MLAHNRILWAHVLQETDNDREWIPNPGQANAFGLTVPADMAFAWQDVLADAEAVLDGRLLVPHPFLPEGRGIDASAWLADPSPLDLAGWLHGRDAYPFVAKGPTISAESWLAFQRQTQGGAVAFAFFFN